jgi:hypothetical protein
VLHTTPFHYFRFYQSNNTGLVQIIKLIIMYFCPLPCHLVPFKPK